MPHPYVTRQYAEAVVRDGEAACEVPEWRAWVVRRAIPAQSESATEDVAGCYPVVAFEDGVDLDGGLERLRAKGFVSAVLVVDPILRPEEATLAASFGLCRPFKTHYLHDSSLGGPGYSKHHRYELRRARGEVRRIDLAAYLPAWTALYRDLAARHDISGPAAFSADAFARLAAVKGLVTFGVFVDDELVAGHLWIRHGAYVHSHLAASNEAGRTCGAAYLLYDAAIQYFDDAEMVDFGGGAGHTDDPADGLARFKRGFSNAASPTYLCGEVLDSKRYRDLCDAQRSGDSVFFPAYRAP